MRANYEQFGVTGYYERVASHYRNPHFAGVLEGCALALDQLYEQMDQKTELRAFDLACGSGEATIALETWLRTRSASFVEPPAAVQLDPSTLMNDPIANLRGKARRSHVQLPSDFQLYIDACDPFTSHSYTERTGRPSSTLSFEDIAQGQLFAQTWTVPEREGKKLFDLCICSFAAHLIDPSMIYTTMSQLASAADYLLILSPVKKPQIDESMGWQSIFEMKADLRVHTRLYRSLYG